MSPTEKGLLVNKFSIVSCFYQVPPETVQSRILDFSSLLDYHEGEDTDESWNLMTGVKKVWRSIHLTSKQYLITSDSPRGFPFNPFMRSSLKGGLRHNYRILPHSHKMPGIDRHRHGQEVEEGNKHPLEENSLRRRNENTSFDRRLLTWANVFHFSSSSLAIIPPSSMFKCSGLMPLRIRIIAEPQS